MNPQLFVTRSSGILGPSAYELHCPIHGIVKSIRELDIQNNRSIRTSDDVIAFIRGDGCPDCLQENKRIEIENKPTIESDGMSLMVGAE